METVIPNQTSQAFVPEVDFVRHLEPVTQLMCKCSHEDPSCFPIPYVESDLRSSLRLIQVAKQRRLHRLRAETLWAKPKHQSAKHGGAKPCG
jgi:hypothetical protein